MNIKFYSKEDIEYFKLVFDTRSVGRWSTYGLTFFIHVEKE